MQNLVENNCPLCNTSGVDFYQHKNQIYFKCPTCLGIFIEKDQRPNRETELSRYLKHNNDVDDMKFQKFVSPITTSIMADFKPKDNGLDFGAGSGPVISKILEGNNYNIVQYDPFFHNNPKLLNDKYDYIACCEVIEHFHNPKKEFILLKDLLVKNGKLYCMTNLYNKNIDFHSWDYKNDITHIFIYQIETIYWIKEHFGFIDVKIDGRLITFHN